MQWERTGLDLFPYDRAHIALVLISAGYSKDRKTEPEELRKELLTSDQLPSYNVYVHSYWGL
jgi:hypothetical protein